MTVCLKKKKKKKKPSSDNAILKSARAKEVRYNSVHIDGSKKTTTNKQKTNKQKTYTNQFGVTSYFVAGPDGVNAAKVENNHSGSLC